MDAKLQRRIQRYGWDLAAEHYHHAWRGPLQAAHDTLLHMAALTAGQSVLEVAAGTGLLTERIAEILGPQGELLATDLSAQMVAQLQQRLATQPTGSAQRMDAEQLSLEDHRFDTALCALGLMYMPNPAVALSEMYRVLKPGGRVAATVWGPRASCGWAEIFPIVDREVASEVCPLFFATGGDGALKSLVERAGFKQAQAHRQQEPLCFASEQALLAAMIDGGPVALAVKRFDSSARAHVETAFLDSVSAYRQVDGDYALPGEFVTLAALKPA